MRKFFVNYQIELTNRAQKQFGQLPLADRKRIAEVIRRIGEDPFSGDIARLQGEAFGWRRRVGNYRIIYELIVEQRLIIVVRIERRTTTTYRRR